MELEGKVAAVTAAVWEAREPAVWGIMVGTRIIQDEQPSDFKEIVQARADY